MRRALVPLVGLVALPTPAAVLGLACLLRIVAEDMPSRTWVRRFLLAGVTLCGCLSAVLTGCALLGVAVDPRWLVAALLVAGLVWRVTRPPRASAPLASRSDRWASAFGLLTFAGLYAPFVGASAGRSMALLSQSTDSATHVHLVAAVMRHGGYVHLADPAGMSPMASGYPTGWHGSAWVVAELALGEQPSTAALVNLVAALALGGYAVMSAVAAAIVLDYGFEQGRGRSAPAVAGLLSLSLATLAGFGLYLVQLASFTQVVALVATLSLVLLAAEAPIEPTRLLVVLGATVVVVMQTWYLLALAPVVAGVLLLERGRASRRGVALTALLVAPAAVYPVLTGPRSAHVDEPGPLLLPTIVGVLGLLTATAVGCVSLLSSTVTTTSLRTRVLTGSTVATLVTMVALVARQGFVTGTGVSYYGAKVLLATFLLGSVLASAAVVRGVREPRGRSGLLGLVACAGLAVGVVATAWPAPLGSRVDARTLDALLTDHPRGPSPGTESVVADGCDRVRDMIASKWLYDTSVAWPSGLRASLTAYAQEPRGGTAALVSRLDNPKLTRLELYVHRVCDPEALAALSRDPRVAVIHVP